MLFPTHLLTLSAFNQVGPAASNVELGPNGELCAFLAAGPFPNVGALNGRGKGFQSDFLNAESLADPAEGNPIERSEAETSVDSSLVNPRKEDWQLVLGSPVTGVDLNATLNGSKPAIAYLFAPVYSPTNQQAVIRFGSDDGAKIWCNGTLVFQKQVKRGITRDEDSAQIELHQGLNRILFKIEQIDGGWGLLARLTDTEGKPLAHVMESLSIKAVSGAKPAEGERWVRANRGKPSPLNLVTAAAYDAEFSRITTWLRNLRAEAVDPQKLDAVLKENSPDEVSLTGNLTESISHSLSQIREGFKQSRSKFLAETQENAPLFKTDVAAEDYVSVMKQGHYFTHADGHPFTPIGYNHNPDWPEFIESNPELPEYDPAETEKYIAHLHAKGVNVLRLMVETPPSGNLESPIGTFSPEHVKWLDTIVGACRENEIKLILTPWDTFWMNLRFDASTYNPALGGPLKSKIDFITSPKMRDIEKNRLKFLINRYGNSGVVFAWEILNEGDIWWGETPLELKSWIEDIAGYVHDYEFKKWGRNHLISVSIANPMPEGDLADDAFRLPQLNYATTHLYIGASRAPTEAIKPAFTEHEGVAYCLHEITDNRPYMDTENGPIDHWVADAKLDNHVFENMSWAHLASGGAGSSFRWPYRHPHHLTEGMLTTLHAMSVFTGEVPWASLATFQVPLNVTGDQGAATFGIAGTGVAIAWTSGSRAIEVSSNFGAAPVTVRLFDCRAGTWLPEQKAAAERGRIRISLPDSSRPFAVILRAN